MSNKQRTSNTVTRHAIPTINKFLKASKFSADFT